MQYLSIFHRKKLLLGIHLMIIDILKRQYISPVTVTGTATMCLISREFHIPENQKIMCFFKFYFECDKFFVRGEYQII